MTTSEIILTIATITLPVVSSVLTAILNNWEKINPSKRKSKETYEIVQEIKSENALQHKKFDEMSETVETMASALRTSLQTHILSDCKKIQNAIDIGDVDYEEELKQLIILYREYFLCGYNKQGKLYFNDTINKAADDNNTLVHELMNIYFPEYDPVLH